MRLTLSAAERLVVAADFKPDLSLPPLQQRNLVLDKVYRLGDKLADLGICLKVNSALRACEGYDLIDNIGDCGLTCFADLKLIDISETMAIDGLLLHSAKPKFVTAMAAAGSQGLKALRAAVHERTAVLAVTVLTTFDEQTCKAVYGDQYTIDEAVVRLARIGNDAGVAGFVASAKEASLLRNGVIDDSKLIVTAGIRPGYLPVESDDQNKKRAMTPEEAIKAGADIVVIGRPITQAPDPREAAIRVLEELAKVS